MKSTDYGTLRHLALKGAIVTLKELDADRDRIYAQFPILRATHGGNVAAEARRAAHRVAKVLRRKAVKARRATRLRKAKPGEIQALVRTCNSHVPSKPKEAARLLAILRKSGVRSTLGSVRHALYAEIRNRKAAA